jgi:hypothetical protein
MGLTPDARQSELNIYLPNGQTAKSGLNPEWAPAAEHITLLTSQNWIWKELVFV